MKKVKKLQATGFYVIKIRASANSAIAEKVRHGKRFLEILDQKLNGFAIVHRYLIQRGSIILVLQLAEEQKIHDKYKSLRNASNKANRALDFDEVWRIISEQFRHVISQYVVWFNKETGRKGSMVARRYERYFFESEEEANLYMEQMNEETLEESGQRKKYRAGKRVGGLINYSKRGIIFLTSKNLREEIESSFFKGRVFRIQENLVDVVRQLVNATKFLHKSIYDTNISTEILQFE